MSKQPLRAFPKEDRTSTTPKPHSSNSNGVSGPHTQHSSLPATQTDSQHEHAVNLDSPNEDCPSKEEPALEASSEVTDLHLVRKANDPPQAKDPRPACHSIDVGSGSSSGSRPKYTRANHLLNFTPQPRPAQNSTGKMGPKPSRSRSKYNKDDFLQANFRFLVSDTVDIESFMSHADKMFDWEDIAQVEMMVTTMPKCPITLDSPPIAPQITPCGHVFSFSGIMQHLVVSGGQDLRCAAKCPLCFTLIVARDLRRVVFQHVEPPKVGSTISFHLLKRGRESIIPELIGSDAYAHHDNLRCNRFCKFTTIRDAHSVWAADAVHLAEAYSQVMSEGGIEAALEGPALCAGLETLAERAKAWTSRHTIRKSSHRHPNSEKVCANTELFVRKEFARTISSIELHNAQKYAAVRTDQEFPVLPVKPKSDVRANMSQAEGASDLQCEGDGLDIDCLNVKTIPQPSHDNLGAQSVHHEGEESEQAAPDYYFYQAADGQWLYLHPVNMKCLTQMFGQPGCWPGHIEANIVELEDMIQADATRKRYRHLAHIPITGSFSLVEVDISHMISPEYMQPVKKREELRLKRAKQKKREERNQKRLADRAVEVSRAPTIEDFKTMPDLPTALSMGADDIGGLSSAAGCTQEDSPGRGGISWSSVTKLGFAATWGQDPDVGTISREFPSLCKGQMSRNGSHQSTNRGSWKSKLGETTPVPKTQAAELRPPQPFHSAPKKGKKGKMILLSNSQRRG